MPRSFFRRITIPSNISTYLSRTLIIITLTTTFLIGSVLIIQQTLYFNKISQQKSQEYIADQKTHIQETVKNELEYIRIQDIFFRQKVNGQIRQNVNQAIQLAESIYQKYTGRKTEEEIKSLIIATVSALKFEMEYEEVFISTFEGEGVYYPRRPEFTGKNMLRFKDAYGSSVIHEEINLLKNNTEGFLYYNNNSKATSETSPHKKISFVKEFGHFNWYFGSKQYIEDYFPGFRDEIAQKISSVRLKHGGYLFMNNINGIPIVMDGIVYQGNLNLLTDVGNPRQTVFVEELDVLNKNPEGGFFYYKWNKINETSPIDKCSYVQLFKEYNWIIGSGFYLDEIDRSIQDQQNSLRQDQRKSILTILLILVVLLFLEALIIYHFNKRYKSDFERFFNFFYLSKSDFNKLNLSEFHFNEFKRAGIAANNMILLREEIENKLIEEQKKATRSDRLKSAFLANMSHEIRTPMNAILGFSELLEDASQDEQDRILFIKLIRNNGEMLLNLINDIIDISKIEANLLSVRKRQVKLDKFLAELQNHYKEILTSRKDKIIQFSIDNTVNPDVSILTDEIRLKQILDNLIGNAIKFTTRGSIVLDVKMVGEVIYFSVTDTGIGIPPDQQILIFERFIQAEQGSKVNFGGTGLGLAISRNLIELLGGSIEVKSEPSIGSTFYFHIQAN